MARGLGYTQKMEIGIDVSPLKTGHSIRGTGSYTKLLIEALEKYETDHSYHFFTRGQNIPKNVDLVHYPYFDPFFLTLPIQKQKPVVVTVHDLIPISFARHFPRGMRGEMKWQIQKRSLSQAGGIITDSRASKTDISHCVNFDKEKIHVVYLAPGEKFKPVKDSKLLQKTKDKFHLPDQFVLYVGDVNWNKNVPGLIRAICELRQESLKLVLVGKSFLNENLPEVNGINHLIEDLDFERQVQKLGFLSGEELRAVYNLASVYVQPSFAEGFGLPVLEAMACGCPVVCSKATSLLEIAGPSILVDPNSTQKIAEGIKKGLSVNRQTWSREASEYLKRFSWKRTANETVSVYKSIFHS